MHAKYCYELYQFDADLWYYTKIQPADDSPCCHVIAVPKSFADVFGLEVGSIVAVISPEEKRKIIRIGRIEENDT